MTLSGVIPATAIPRRSLFAGLLAAPLAGSAVQTPAEPLAVAPPGMAWVLVPETAWRDFLEAVRALAEL